MTFEEMLKIQKKFNNIVIGETLSDNEREESTKDLALCAHSEIGMMLNAVNYKSHHMNDEIRPSKDTILYESADVIRYMMAILNVWDIDSSEFEAAFKDKDIYLNSRQRIKENVWDEESMVAIVDIDDVLAEFRFGFAEWLREEKDIKVDTETDEYYFISALSQSEQNPEEIFEEFLASGGFRSLIPNSENLKIVRTLYSSGFHIHLLTSRPSERQRCLYDTYAWLDKLGVPYDDISFATEKFRWCAKSKYYDNDKIAFAIDDSPKHIQDYAVHGIKCFVPKHNYNKGNENKNVYYFKGYDEFYKQLDVMLGDVDRDFSNNR